MGGEFPCWILNLFKSDILVSFGEAAAEPWGSAGPWDVGDAGTSAVTGASARPSVGGAVGTVSQPRRTGRANRGTQPLTEKTPALALPHLPGRPGRPPSAGRRGKAASRAEKPSQISAW